MIYIEVIKILTLCRLAPPGFKEETGEQNDRIFDFYIAGERFIITSLPHKKRNIGFPLDSLSIQIESGKYYMDIHTPGKRAESIYNVYRNFFAKALKL